MRNDTKETGYHAVVHGTLPLQVKQGLKTQKSSELRRKRSNTEGHLKPAPGLCWRLMENIQVQQLSCLDQLPGVHSGAFATIPPCCLDPAPVSDSEFELPKIKTPINRPPVKSLTYNLSTLHSPAVSCCAVARP